MEDRFKFRAWNKESGAMYYNVSPSPRGGGKICFDTTLENICGCEHGIKLEKQNGEFISEDFEKDLNKNLILMQCTGLKDNNGKLIFEGDIVKIFIDDDITGDVREFLGAIVWDQKELRFRLGREHREFELKYAGGIKIIGNIYESPELLNK